MAASSGGNDPHRFAFWNQKNRERGVSTPFRQREHRERIAASQGRRALRVAQIAFDLIVAIAWILLIVMTLFFPSDMPDPRFGPYD